MPKPKTLANLPQQKQADLKRITKFLTEKCEEIKKIILFGSYARGDYKLKRGKNRGKQSDFDILIVVDDYEIEEKVKKLINKRSFPPASNPVQFIVENIAIINSNLRDEQYFFSDVIKEGIVLYDDGDSEFVEAEVPTSEKRKEIAKKDFELWFDEANDSFYGYQKYQEVKKFKRASFHLQQTVEMCYTAIEMVFSHYNPYEHNLRIIRDRVEMFDKRIAKVLPIKTEKQRNLFDKLNYAYIGGRYQSKEDFPITKEELDYWSREAKKLLDLTEIVCRERIERC